MKVYLGHTSSKDLIVSVYSNGKKSGALRTGSTIIQRWEHRVCESGAAAEYMRAGGWARVAVEGKFWRSGSQRYTWTRSFHGAV